MRIRRCRIDDLRALEWEHALVRDRDIIAATFARTEHGDMEMLVGELGGDLVGQIWIDFARADVGYLWALRVRAECRGRGFGTRLLAAGEHAIAARARTVAELEVEPANVHARQLYERRGYVWIAQDPRSQRAVLRKVLCHEI